MNEVNATAPILSRIIITHEGDLVVTDLWDDVRSLLNPHPQESFELPRKCDQLRL